MARQQNMGIARVIATTFATRAGYREQTTAPALGPPTSGPSLLDDLASVFTD
jgi:hypothetical protein